MPVDVHHRPFVVLTDDTVRLHCLRLQDVETHVAGEDEDQVRWLNEGHHSTTARVREWIVENHEQWTQGGPRRHFGIFDRTTGDLAGGVEANWGLLPGAPAVVNLSYAVFPHWRGRGIAARSVGLVCDWLQELPLSGTAVIRTDPRNHHSRRVAANSGFTEKGIVAADGEEFAWFEKTVR